MKRGWQIGRLGDLIDIQNGFAFSSKDYSESGYFVIRIGNVQNGDILLSDPKFIDLPSFSPLQRFALSKGDILVSLTGNVGRVGVIEKEHLPAVLNQRVARITIKEDSPVTRDFLLLFLYSDLFREELIGAGHGAAQQNVSTKDLVEILLPVPQLPEQHRLVSILDEALDGITTAKANAEKNLQNVRALFESYLQNVFNQRGPGWVERQLGDLCSLITDGKHGDCRNEEGSGYYFLSAKDVKQDTLNFDNARQINKHDFEETHRRTNLKPNDICMVNTGATIGKLALAPDDPRTLKTTFQKSVAVIKPISSAIYNAYCYYHLKADLTKLVNASSGSAQKNLLLGDLRAHLISMPHLAEQAAIVAKLDSLRDETQRLESIYQQKLTALDELKKSLLHQAFTGQL
jgi:type I restriction enzyme S subunit